jgi:integrase/recombinase XerD
MTRKPITTEKVQETKAVGSRPASRQGAGAARPGPGIPGKKPVAREESPVVRPASGMQLHTIDGARKYLTASERALFLKTAEIGDRDVRTLCMTLAYAGCRLSEALALTADRVDLAAGVLVFESLKKRRSGVFRVVPVPPALLDTLDMVHGIREWQGKRGKGRDVRLWPWSRMTAWRQVHAVMEGAGLSGPHASPKGLRHGFGVAAVSAGIPLNLVQKWLGHAQLSTTAIYADAVGAEEKDIARRMWG